MNKAEFLKRAGLVPETEAEDAELEDSQGYELAIGKSDEELGLELDALKAKLQGAMSKIDELENQIATLADNDGKKIIDYGELLKAQDANIKMLQTKVDELETRLTQNEAEYQHFQKRDEG